MLRQSVAQPQIQLISGGINGGTWPGRKSVNTCRYWNVDASLHSLSRFLKRRTGMRELCRLGLQLQNLNHAILMHQEPRVFAEVCPYHSTLIVPLEQISQISAATNRGRDLPFWQNGGGRI